MEIEHKGEVMEVKRILYATNLSEPSFRVLEGLSGLSGFGWREVVLLCALGKQEGSKDLTLDLFETWKEKLKGFGVDVTIRIDPGNLAASVLNTIHGESISLIILHLDKKEERRMVGGSSFRKIMKSTDLPVMVVDKDEKGLNFSTKGMFERVLLPADWSPEYEKALQHVLDLKELISELELVNVIFEKLSLRDVQQLMEEMINTRKMCLKLGISAEYHMYAGETTEEILRAAHEYESTVIVMGTTRRRKFKDIFLGRPSYRVIEKAPIPVLLVP